MKKLYTLLSIILICSCIANAQTPQGFKYQAVVRDNSGLAIANKLVAIRLSLLLNSPNGTSVYSEVHKIATNDFGVANLNVGSGSSTIGNFANIDWGAGTYFLKTEADITNGSNFVFLGTSQLLSVPYAMYAAKSANAANDFDKDSLNEIQNLNVSNNKLSITKGNQVNIDADTTNEIQTLTLTNNNLQLNKNGGSVDLTKYDKDSQQLVLNGNTLSITKGNSIVLSAAVDLDADPTNEIQNLSIKKDTLSLSKANYIVLPKDIDADSTNEIQTLTYKNDTIQLSKSNLIKLPKDNDRDSLNELQTIRRSNDTLYLSKSNFTVLPKINSVPSGTIISLAKFDSTLLTNGYNYLGRQLIYFQPYISDSINWQWDDCFIGLNAPINRNGHSSVYTGTDLIIWGGWLEDGSTFTNEGWRYNFNSNQWIKISDVNAPSPRYYHTAIWTGSEMIVWGGNITGGFTGAINDGYKYNPVSDTWTTISGLSAPSARYGHTAIWTGTEMIVWGGTNDENVAYNDGKKYNPSTNIWTSITSTGIPSGRYYHSSVWTGSEMIIWGGKNGGSYPFDNGGKYNPFSDSWNLNISPSLPNGQHGRIAHSAIWSGNEMVVWGGSDNGRYFDSYLIYKPISNNWEVNTPTNLKPTRRANHTASWINNKMLIWGGKTDLTSIDCIGRYLKKSSPTHGSINSVFRYDFIKQ